VKAVAEEKKKFKPYTKKRFCPKCGTGVHLAEHKDRFSCGRCGYLEMKR
jgi:small subunit ribosomal protein S27Ae